MTHKLSGLSMVVTSGYAAWSSRVDGRKPPYALKPPPFRADRLDDARELMARLTDEDRVTSAEVQSLRGELYQLFRERIDAAHPDETDAQRHRRAALALWHVEGHYWDLSRAGFQRR